MFQCGVVPGCRIETTKQKCKKKWARKSSRWRREGGEGRTKSCSIIQHSQVQHQGCSVSHCEKDKKPERIQVSDASGVIWGGKSPAAFIASPSRKMGGMCYCIVVQKRMGSWLFNVIIFSLSSFYLFPQDDTVLLSNWRVWRKEISPTECTETWIFLLFEVQTQAGVY